MCQPLASIVIATFNRRTSLLRLLGTLCAQTVASCNFEVVIVDDGSAEDVSEVVESFRQTLQVTLLRQSNSGVAVARQRGVERAKAPIIIFLDDDMLVRDDFVAQHLRLHGAMRTQVVMGQLLADQEIAHLPLFERFYAHVLGNASREFLARGTFAGSDVYTGNLSMSRELFMAVGGFDASFHIEDSELGVRLEAAGATFVFAAEAASIHASDHRSLTKWLARSIVDGRDWVHLMRKHPTAFSASPWRHMADVNPLALPFLVLAMVLPRQSTRFSRWICGVANGVDAVGMGPLAIAGASLAYGMQYYSGVRTEHGSLWSTLKDYVKYATRQRAAPSGAAQRHADGQVRA